MCGDGGGHGSGGDDDYNDNIYSTNKSNVG